MIRHNNSIAQQSVRSTAYFLGDALGSVRQLVDERGTVTLTQSYEPYGQVLNSTGSGSSGYGFTGEWTSQRLIDLRARFYSPYLNQFIQTDTIVPDPLHPMDGNKYLYVWDNPINKVDPSGKYPACEGQECYRYALEDVFRLYGLNLTGEGWSLENKSAIIYAVELVSRRFTGTIGMNSNNGNVPRVFQAVYGIREDSYMTFKWNPNCYNCRLDYCKITGNIAGEGGQGREFWEDNDEEIPLKNGEITKGCDCKPKGAFTHNARMIEFASMWDNSWVTWQQLRKVNNVIHELGHAFNVRTNGNAVGAVGPYSAKLNGETWTLLDRTHGFFRDDGKMIYEQSIQVSSSEIFADMFLGWVYNKWSLDQYGTERGNFMNERMRGWIESAMGH